MGFGKFLLGGVHFRDDGAALKWKVCIEERKVSPFHLRGNPIVFMVAGLPELQSSIVLPKHGTNRAFA
jgi:hypothetical protein